MSRSAPSSKDVADTWPKCTGPVADGGGGSDRVVEAGGCAAAVDEHAFGLGAFGLGAFGLGAFGLGAFGGEAGGEPIFGPACGASAAGERAGPGPGARLGVDPAGEPAVAAAGGLPAALGAPADSPR